MVTRNVTSGDPSIPITIPDTPPMSLDEALGALQTFQGVVAAWQSMASIIVNGKKLAAHIDTLRSEVLVMEKKRGEVAEDLIRTQEEADKSMNAARLHSSEVEADAKQRYATAVNEATQCESRLADLKNTLRKDEADYKLRMAQMEKGALGRRNAIIDEHAKLSSSLIAERDQLATTISGLRFELAALKARLG